MLNFAIGVITMMMGTSKMSEEQTGTKQIKILLVAICLFLSATFLLILSFKP